MYSAHKCWVSTNYLFRRGLVDLVSGCYSFGRYCCQPQLCCYKVGRKVTTEHQFGHYHGSYIGRRQPGDNVQNLLYTHNYVYCEQKTCFLFYLVKNFA